MSVVIIAEVGVNHNGNINIAKKLIDVAADAGVDYVKFQTFKADKLVNKNAKKATYQEVNTGNNDSQYKMLKKLELSNSDHEILMEYCEQKNVKFLSTGFDIDSIDYLSDGKIDFIKIPSGEVTNYPYLKKCASKQLPIVMSTGMCTLLDVKAAIKVLIRFQINPLKITLLHCNTDYPTLYEDVNLRAMKTLENEFNLDVGYSDHTLGIEVPIAAVALGAKVIEKHITLDRSMVGPDHSASIEPDELKKMVISIRNIETALGSDIKKPSNSEMKNISVARKSIHIVNDLKANTILTEEMLIMKRPGDGISPMEINKVIGCSIKRNLKADYKLTLEDIL